MKIIFAVLLLWGCAMNMYAQELYQQAKQPLAALKDTTLIAPLLDKANELTEEDKWDEAISVYETTLRSSMSLQYDEGMIHSYLGLFLCYLRKSEFLKSYQLLDEAEAIWLKTRKKVPEKYEASIEYARGMVLDRMGKYELAVKHYQNCVRIRRALKIPVAGIYSALGQLLKKSGNHTWALHYLELSEMEATASGNTRILAATWINKASLLYDMEPNAAAWPKSIELTQKAVTLLKQGANRPENTLSSALVNLAVYEMKARHPDLRKAQAWLAEAGRLKEVNDFEKAHVYVNIADLNRQTGQYRQANQHLDTAFALASQIRSPEKLVSVFKGKAALYKQLHQYKEALAYHEKADSMADEIAGDKTKQAVSHLQYEYETGQKDVELAKKQLLIARQQTIIQRKNTLTYSIIAGVALSGTFIGLLLLNRRRIQRKEAQQALEIASWRASLEGEERERQRLAHQLHDHIGGNLSTLAMWMDNIKKDVYLYTQQSNYNEALQLLHTTLTEVRNTAHHLMPELLLRFGLAEALRIFCSNVQKASGIEIQYHYFGYVGELGKNNELIIYRCVQELVQNILKHSGANRALVQLSGHEDLLSITIEDNGNGLAENSMEKKGMGLASIENSIQKLNGQFRIHSDGESGTSVEMEIRIPAPGA